MAILSFILLTSKEKIPKPLDEEQRANLQLMIEDIVFSFGHCQRSRK